VPSPPGQVRSTDKTALITMVASERSANIAGVNYVTDGGLIKTTEERNA
jgi:hypothetical protein